jgi:hypothetical protein
VNEAFAKAYLAGRDPLGREISVAMQRENPLPAHHRRGRRL